MTRTHTRTDAARKLARLTGLAAAVASIAMMVAPATGLAAAPVKFGAELNPTVQPSNSLPGLTCMGTEAPGPACTMVLNEAYGRPDGGEFAPKTGTIRRIRLIAGGPGSFKLQLAKVKRGTDEAKFAAGGPRIDYQGQTEANFDSGSYKVETFDVNVPVKKGQQLALRGNITSMIRCSSGGDNTLIYTPPLISGGSFRPATADDGCWILMEAVIR
jgi:hypothetical protein